jgi:Protein of unknown function (DUF1573)
MKFFVTILLFFLFNSQLSFAQSLIYFPTDKAHLDTLIEGEIKTMFFAFQNKGDDTLTLTNVHSSCGCAIPAWKQHAIAPGYWDTIQAAYNSVGHLGAIHKSVYVESNGGNVELKLDGAVVPFAPDLRLYYGSSGSLVHYEVEKNKSATTLHFKLYKDAEGKYSGDVSLVINNENLIPKILSISQAELLSKGITVKVLRQQNMSISYAAPYDNKLEDKVTFIYRFYFQKTKNTDLSMLIDQQKIKLTFSFEN